MAAQVENLQSAIEAKDAEITALKAAEADFKAKTEELNAVITDLRAMKNAWQPAAREAAAGGHTRVDAAAASFDVEKAKEVAAKLKQ